MNKIMIKNKYSIVYKDEVENIMKQLKTTIHKMESLGNRYYDGRPIQIQDAVRHARESHQRLMIFKIIQLNEKFK